MFDSKEFRFVLTLIFVIIFYFSVKTVLEFFGIGFDTYGPYLMWVGGIFLFNIILDKKVTHLAFN